MIKMWNITIFILHCNDKDNEWYSVDKMCCIFTLFGGIWTHNIDMILVIKLQLRLYIRYLKITEKVWEIVIYLNQQERKEKKIK